MSSRNKLCRVDYEVVIVGGSVAGAALAALIGKQGHKVAIVEPMPEAAGAEDDDTGRVLAITRASEYVLRAANAWEHIDQNRCGKFRAMQVWDSEGAGRVAFDSADICEPTLGHIIGGPTLQRGLESALKHCPQVLWYRPARVVEFTAYEDRVDVTLEDGRTLRSRLLVGADGANSVVRKNASIAVAEHDYGQSAITCKVQTGLPHGDVARQQFMRSGPLAFLPLADAHTCSIVWTTHNARAHELSVLDDKAFIDALQDAFAAELGAVVAVGPRSIFPLHRAHAKEYVKHRLALVGDAAHRIHPLAGQGANLGLMDVAALTETVLQASAFGRDIGAWAVLRRYERWRKGENLAMMFAMDAFKDGFGTPLTPFRWLRNMGLTLTDRSPFLKQIIMRRAMGLTGDLPTMLSGPAF